MRKVSELLATRPTKSSYLVPADLPVAEALRRLAFNGHDALFVTDGPEVVGTLTDKALLLRLATGRGNFEGLAVRDVMTASVAYATPDTTLLECMIMMTGYVNGAMPVLHQGKLAGVVEMREVTREVLARRRRRKAKRPFFSLNAATRASKEAAVN